MSQPNENQNPDTTYTKIYVGGLAWATKEEGLRSFFEQFGEITHLNVVCDRQTGRSKGFGFVTFKDAESAARACVNPTPTIEGRTTNCKLASSGNNANNNQSNQTVLRPDDLSFLAVQPQPSNLHQPLPTYVGHSWNQGYPCYYPQPSYHYDPQYYSQSYPQYYPEPYQFYPMVASNPTHWPHHEYMDDSDGN